MKRKLFAKWPNSLPVPSSIKYRGTFTLICVDSLFPAAHDKTLSASLKSIVFCRNAITSTIGLCLLNHNAAFSYQDDSELP